MNLEELRLIVLTEREKGGLTEIPPDVFDKGREEINRIIKIVLGYDNQLCDEARSIYEEVSSLEESLKEISQIRIRKIVSLAVSLTLNNYHDHNEIKLMAPAEKMMYESVTANVELCQRATIGSKPVLSPQQVLVEPEPAEESDEESPVIVSDAVILKAEHKIEEKLPVAESAKLVEKQHKPFPYEVVHILEDVDMFMGMDGRTYDVSKGDIITLPIKNAEILCERNIARKIVMKTP